MFGQDWLCGRCFKTWNYFKKKSFKYIYIYSPPLNKFSFASIFQLFSLVTNASFSYSFISFFIVAILNLSNINPVISTLVTNLLDLSQIQTISWLALSLTGYGIASYFHSFIRMFGYSNARIPATLIVCKVRNNC